jgi:signal transduction histidine kinase/ActR/RegA family two-component response regulator
MIVPLGAHGRTLGAMTFVSAESGRRYTDADLRLAQEVGYRSAIAVDNARAYAEIRRANALKDEFIATLSHELRTPLNALLGYTRLLQLGALPADQHASAFGVIARNSTALARIIDDVLDVSRIVAGKLRLDANPVDLGQVMTESLESVQTAADARQVALTLTLPAEAVVVAGDSDRIQQVMWNLLSNAVKFTPARGRVTVRLDRVDTDAVIVVEDTGIGISAEFLPHVFERFRQADTRFARTQGGLGLGLAIARHLVEMHGGEIAAASSGLDCGATFTVRLPIGAPGPELPSQGDRRTLAADAATVRLDGTDVLIVDDDPDERLMMQAVLEVAGARVTSAASGAEALARLGENPPDLLLSDIGMPGMDGIELIKRVRAAAPGTFAGVRAMAITAYARDGDRARALDAGYHAHVAKPIDPVDLLARVAAVLQA